jgi:hypothetical protein
MTERLTQRVLLAFAFCLVLIAIPVVAQHNSDGQLMWRDDNGNQHFQDEEGNYLINSQNDRNSDIQSDSQTQFDDDTVREKPSETQTDMTTRNSAALDEESDEGLPATAGELPLLGLIGMLSLAGAGAARAFFNTRR